MDSEAGVSAKGPSILNGPAAARQSIFGPASGAAGETLTLDSDCEKRTWWLDVLSPTDEEMKMLSHVSWKNIFYAPFLVISGARSG
jgi:hypothetical protein